MTITEEDAKHVALLARLELSDDEIKQTTQELSKILGIVEQLNKVDLTSIECDLQSDYPALTRLDDAKINYDREILLKNAPEPEDGFYRVPQILEHSSSAL